MAITYNDLYLNTRAALKRQGVEMAQLEARELVCYAAEKPREQFFRDLNLYASPAVEQRVSELLRRREGGEPIAYLIGEWEFYGMTLDVTPDVLIPRPDTELLVERGIELAQAAGEGARVLDLCAGSGCIGLAVAKHAPNCRVILADLSEAALRVCRANVRRCNLNARVTCTPVNAMDPPSSALWDFDVILCNPPYIPTDEIKTLDASVREHEPILALDGGADGLDFYRAISSQWGNALRLGGSLLFEVGIHQAPAVEALLVQNGFEGVTVTPDPAGIPRMVEGRVPC